MSKSKHSIFQLILSMLIAKWLWQRFQRPQNKKAAMSPDDIKNLEYKLEETNRHWDSL